MQTIQTHEYGGPQLTRQSDRAIGDEEATGVEATATRIRTAVCAFG